MTSLLRHFRLTYHGYKNFLLPEYVELMYKKILKVWRRSGYSFRSYREKMRGEGAKNSPPVGRGLMTETLKIGYLRLPLITANTLVFGREALAQIGAKRKGGS